MKDYILYKNNIGFQNDPEEYEVKKVADMSSYAEIFGLSDGHFDQISEMYRSEIDDIVDLDQELKNPEYSPDLVLHLLSKEDSYEVEFKKLQLKQTIPELTSLLEKNDFLSNIEDPVATVNYFVENHGRIIDEYVNINV